MDICGWRQIWKMVHLMENLPLRVACCVNGGRRYCWVCSGEIWGGGMQQRPCEVSLLATYLVCFLAKNECTFALPGNTDRPCHCCSTSSKSCTQPSWIICWTRGLRWVNPHVAGEHLGSLLFCVNTCVSGRQWEIAPDCPVGHFFSRTHQIWWMPVSALRCNTILGKSSVGNQNHFLESHPVFPKNNAFYVLAPLKSETNKQTKSQ